MSVAFALENRLEFLFRGFLALIWMGLSLVPLQIAYSQRQSVAGWTYPEALLVVGWFSLLKAVLDGALNPSLSTVLEGVRTGSLDFILLKPIDAQFLVSTARFEPWLLLEVLAALAIIARALSLRGILPGPGDLLLAFVLLLVAIILLYSLWMLFVSAAFWAIQIDSVAWLAQSVFDMARWPVDVFKGMFGGALQLLFSTLFPLALMTTYPAMALLGKLNASLTLASLLGGGLFCALARAIWRRGLRSYSSASS